jgi:hypothetical protein
MRQIRFRFGGASSVLLLLGFPAATSAQEDVFGRVAGTWRWEYRADDCQENPHTISFSEDRRFMILSYPLSKDTHTVRYEILAIGPSAIRGKMLGETRTTPAGQTVVWDLVLVTPDSYCWHRTDWAPDGCTRLNVRCPVRGAVGPPNWRLLLAGAPVAGGH